MLRFLDLETPSSKEEDVQVAGLKPLPINRPQVEMEPADVKERPQRMGGSHGGTHHELVGPAAIAVQRRR